MKLEDDEYNLHLVLWIAGVAIFEDAVLAAEFVPAIVQVGNRMPFRSASNVCLFPGLSWIHLTYSPNAMLVACQAALFPSNPNPKANWSFTVRVAALRVLADISVLPELRDKYAPTLANMIESICNFVLQTLEAGLREKPVNPFEVRDSRGFSPYEARELLLASYALLQRWVVNAPALALPSQAQVAPTRIKLFRAAVEGQAAQVLSEEVRAVAEVLYQLLVRRLGSKVHLNGLSSSSTLLTETAALSSLLEAEDADPTDPTLFRCYTYRGSLITLVEYTCNSSEEKSLIAIVRDALGKYAWKLESPVLPETGSPPAAAKHVRDASATAAPAAGEPSHPGTILLDREEALTACCCLCRRSSGYAQPDR